MEQQDEVPLINAYKQELDRRLQRYQQDPTISSTWEEVKQQLGFSQ
ncbi:addiction module protein [Phormidesmis priestleyi]